MGYTLYTHTLYNIHHGNPEECLFLPKDWCSERRWYGDTKQDTEGLTHCRQYTLPASTEPRTRVQRSTARHWPREEGLSVGSSHTKDAFEVLGGAGGIERLLKVG